MKEENYFLKKTKTRGQNYYKIFKRDQDGKEIYVMMAGTPTKIYEKLVLLEKLKGSDQQLLRIRDQILLRKDIEEIDQQTNNNIKTRHLD